MYIVYLYFFVNRCLGIVFKIKMLNKLIRVKLDLINFRGFGTNPSFVGL